MGRRSESQVFLMSERPYSLFEKSQRYYNASVLNQSFRPVMEPIEEKSEKRHEREEHSQTSHEEFIDFEKTALPVTQR